MRKFIALMMLGIVLSSAAQKPRTTASHRTKSHPSQTSQRPQKSQKSQHSQKSQSKPSQKEQLQNQQKQLKKDIASNQQRRAELQRKVKQQLEDALVLGTEIDEQKRVIDTLHVALDSIENEIVLLNSEKQRLEGELHDRQARYANSVRYMHRNRRAQSKMMFVLSAKNINQMYRRTRFMNEYATYQRAQGEAVKQKEAQVEQKCEELAQAKASHISMLQKEESERQKLQRQQEQKQQMADELQKQQRTVTALIAQQQKEEQELNARIDKLIAEEIAREQARLEAERKRKAEEQARLERKERERKARQQRLAEAKAREEKARREAREAKTNEEKAAAKQRAKNAEKDRKTAEKEVEEDRKQEKREAKAVAKAERHADADPDTRLTGSFVSNKGRMPMPITGDYQMLKGFGDNIVDGARGVHITSKGIYLKGQPGAKARCIFDGEVSKIYSTGTSYIVMVRHGRYISVYSDLASVSVTTGQKVSTSQTLGPLGPTNIMQFQLRNWTELLNPRAWLRR